MAEKLSTMTLEEQKEFLRKIRSGDIKLDGGFAEFAEGGLIVKDVKGARR